MSPSSPSPQDELRAIAADAKRQLELVRSFGVERLPFDPQRVEERAKELQTAMSKNRSSAAGSKQQALDELRKALEPCCKCDIAEARTHLVFGDGDPDADLMFIGEAPGQQEDLQGVPFVGRAGQLLTRIIEAIGLARDRVYIGNILKCRPPNNRTPTVQESATCFPNLERQIEIIQPRIIVTLGNPATKTLLETTQGITRMRGRFVEWRGIEVMPTYHPSYLLRNPDAKRDVWEDMKKVHARMRELGLEIGELKSAR